MWMCEMPTEEKEQSCLEAIRVKRVSLVDEVEERIDSVLDVLLSREVFNRDDREEVLCQNVGPRAKVRKVLDILEGKGEEAAKIFLCVVSQQETTASNAVGKGKDPPLSSGMYIF